MDAMEALLTRRSVRGFTEQPITDEQIEQILAAAMSGPSCRNCRDWQFLVVRDKEMLTRMADVNGPQAAMLKTAAVGIVICGDLERAWPSVKEYWVIDAAIAAQNLTLAAHALGIGSVWLGTYPQMERVTGQAELFGLPEHILPHSILALGYPDVEHRERIAKVRKQYEADKVHFEHW